MTGDEVKETYVMVPTTIAAKAKQLAGVGLFSQALEILERNRVEFDVYPTRVEMRLPQPVRAGRFQKGNTIGSATNKFGRRKPATLGHGG